MTIFVLQKCKIPYQNNTNYRNTKKFLKRFKKATQSNIKKVSCFLLTQGTKRSLTQGTEKSLIQGIKRSLLLNVQKVF